MSDLNLAQVWLKFKSQVAVEELLTVLCPCLKLC